MVTHARNYAAVMVVAAVGVNSAARGAARGGPDFDGDGFEDLVVNVVYEDLEGHSTAGLVHVIYGSSSGPSAAGDQVWHQNIDGVNDAIAPEEGFGWSFTWGDFDDDGFDDLAVGVIGEVVGGAQGAGGVAVLYGHSGGLRANGDQFFTQDSSGMNDAAAEEEFFGYSIAAGDYDGDGFDDLAIGVPGETVDGELQAGAVQVIYGGNGGLSSAGDVLLTQNTTGVPGAAELGDRMGTMLAAGDFDGNGKDDLAVGVPSEDIETPAAINDCGFVNVFYGSSSGLRGNGADLIGQNDFGADEAEEFEYFGTMMAAGDFDHNGKDDLAIGVNGEDRTELNAGEVDVIYGSSNGLNVGNTERWAKDGGASISLLPGTEGENDFCGASVASGDFDGDGRDDLLIGVPGQDVNGVEAAGEVIVVYGGSNGLRESTAEVFREGFGGMNGSAQLADRFGFGCATGDFDGDERDDAVVGVPYQEVGGVTNAGAVHLIFGGSNGLSSAGDRVVSQETDGIREAAQDLDLFGTLNGVDS